jgi:hypothetical protein
MTHRTLLVLLAAAVAATAQDGPRPGRGAGRMGGFGPPPGVEARFLGAESGMPGRTVKNAPYSADVITESIQTLPDGNRIRQSSTVKVYRDSEGRTRREQAAHLGALSSSGSTSMPSLIFIHDPVSGVSMALNANDKTGSRVAIVAGRGPGGGMGRGPQPKRQSDQAAVRPRRNQANDPNLKTESLGTRGFDGVMADGRRTTMTIPAGKMGNEQPLQIVTETWYSSELQATVYQKRTDPRSGEVVTHFSNISRSEPSRTLFDAPSDYKVTEAGARRGPGPRQNQ